MDSIYDDDIIDMTEGDLFTRDWKLVGTDPPTSHDDSKTSVNVSHFLMYFEEDTMESPVDDQSSYKNTSTQLKSPIVLRRNVPEAIEIMPISHSSLQMYYEYFRSCVKQHNYDELITVCRNERKSPCFDIKNCYLCIPHPKANLDNFTTVEIGGLTCVLLIPQSVIDNMMISLADININVAAAIHDSQSYNGCRVKMSAIYTDCKIDSSSWKGNTYADMFRPILRCKAVTTAVLTVSMILGIVYGRKSAYINRKSLTIVVHAIK